MATAENRGQLMPYEQELLVETVDGILIKAGYYDELPTGRNIDGIIDPLQPQMRKVLEAMYLVGYKDGAARVIYGVEGGFEDASRLVTGFRENIEKSFQAHRQFNSGSFSDRGNVETGLPHRKSRITRRRRS